MTNETIDSASGAFGLAMAAFNISVNTLVVLTKEGAMTSQDALEVMRRARIVLDANEFTKQDPDAAQVAREGLDLAKQLFEAATAQKPLSGTH